MKEKEKTKEKSGKKIGETLKKAGGILLLFAIGAAGGALIAKFLLSPSMKEWINALSFGEFMFVWCGTIVGLYAAAFLHIIVHEAGHLVCGLLSGYQYCSFRIGSLTWVREDGKMVCKRMSIAGTGGQCLMDPPDLLDGRVPYVLYNLGGSLMNVLVSTVFLGLYFLCRGIPVLPVVFLLISLVGYFLAAVNGIPMRMGGVDNDGYNALSMGKNPEALYAFWLQMKINALQTAGTRLKDMPKEWFTLPSEEGMKNSMLAAQAVFVEARLVDAHEFAAASDLIDRLLSAETALVGLYRGMLTCDRIYCELIGTGDPTVVDGLLTKQQRSFMKQMKSYITICRTQYVLALFGETDAKKVEKARAQFEKCAARHPVAADVASERELVELAEAQAKSRAEMPEEN